MQFAWTSICLLWFEYKKTVRDSATAIFFKDFTHCVFIKVLQAEAGGTSWKMLFSAEEINNKGQSWQNSGHIPVDWTTTESNLRVKFPAEGLFVSVWVPADVVALRCV